MKKGEVSWLENSIELVDQKKKEKFNWLTKKNSIGKKEKKMIRKEEEMHFLLLS